MDAYKTTAFMNVIHKGKDQQEHISFYENGKTESIFESRRNKITYLRWYENGQKRSEHHSVNGKDDGVWREYDETGKLVLEKIYNKGVLISEKKF